MRQEAKQLRIDEVRIDGGTQTRAEIDQATIDDYAQEIADGAEFPPVDVFFDGVLYWLSCGFHRWYAARQNECEVIDAIIHTGNAQDARRFAIGNNIAHGKRRTNKDKRREVEMALTEWPDDPNNAIAKKVGVGNKFVGDVKLSLFRTKIDTTRTATRGGTTYPMNTANIGRTPKAEPVVDTSWLDDLTSVEEPAGDAHAQAAASRSSDAAPVQESEEPHAEDAKKGGVAKGPVAAQAPESPYDGEEHLIPEPTPQRVGAVEKTTAVVPPTTVDELGIPIQPHATAAFSHIGEIKELVGMLRECAKRFDELVATEDLAHLGTHAQWVRSGNTKGGSYVMSHIDNAITTLQASTPAVTDCPYRFNEHGEHPENCSVCRGKRVCPSLKKFHRQMPTQLIAAMKAAYSVEGD